MTPLKDGVDCELFRCTDRYIYSADSSGKITARSLGTLDSVNSILAHTAGVSDFDVCGNKIITCGFSSRGGGITTNDPFIKIYDVRNMKALAPISLCFPPVLCRFTNPISEGQITIASKYGQIFTMDLNSTQATELLYQGINGQMPTCMAVSSTRQCCAVGDNQGTVSLCAVPNFMYNANSWPTVLPISEDQRPMMVDDVSRPLNSVPSPLPPINGYCSDYWPADSLTRTMRTPRPIQESTMQEAKKSSSIPYVTNVNKLKPTGRVNICPYNLNLSNQI